MVTATDNITADDTVYAIWDDNDYTITYNLDGGTNSASNPDTFVVTDLDITLEDATKDSNTFGGWFEEVGLTTEITTIDAVGDIEIFAKFTAT